MKQLNREIILQTLSGYAEANRIAELESYSRLKSRTHQESLLIFSQLYNTWKQTGQKTGGNQHLLAQQRQEEHVQLRRMFEIIATKRGDI